MTPTAHCRCLSWLVPGFLVAALGCGLGDYEEKMTKQQKRVDELDKLASEPLELPTGQSLDVFVLPPKGVNLRPETKLYLDRLYQYKGGSDFANVYLGWAPKDKEEDFRNKVLSAFPGQGTTARMTTAPWDRDRDPEDLNTVTIEDTNRTFYVYLTTGNKVALVYEVPKSAKAPREPLQASLNSLALGGDAGAQRKEFKKRRPAAKK